MLVPILLDSSAHIRHVEVEGQVTVQRQRCWPRLNFDRSSAEPPKLATAIHKWHVIERACRSGWMEARQVPR